ncbi:hypothetical protein PISMIDRAFT_23520 [Pisolithus microcarpus 441]|uniref:Uncharacterized protein n=1 Tax=Pisolithus microcarpus 441 TaxID=765257 RepID=A0A0C9YEA0_9AGAM|nr:hypothetical protein PISMIDRAFT_23520 [Pisolithus microcarpus 441]
MHERETMYQRECDELRKQICVNRETAASLETKMNERETMYQQECAKLHEQIHINHETAASQRKNDMENFCKQFEVEMNDWVEKLTASSHLNLTRAMEQRDQELDEKAAKESELANLEQKYARCRHQEDEDIPDASTTERENPVPPSCDNGQLPSSQASTVIDAVTKGVEAALKNILANEGSRAKLAA